MSMGHSEVFTHVGDQVRVHAPNGRPVAPLVTGTFGSSDFIHSLLGGKSVTSALAALKADLIPSQRLVINLYVLTTVHTMSDLLIL